MEKYSFSAPEGSGRIDTLIADMLEDVSRSRAQQLIEQGFVTADGETVSSKKIKPAEGILIEVTLPDPEPLAVLPEDIPLDIVYEDDDVIVVNKPKGMVVHPAPGNLTGTLVNALLFHCAGSLSSINGVQRPGIVHRIDKDTSGLIMIAKNDAAHTSLSRQLFEHSVTRRYTALVRDNIKEDTGTIDQPIGRDYKDRKRRQIDGSNAKRAVTHYRVMERFGSCTLVECRLETGRTHQIRVHMAYIRHPLVGDKVYGSGDETVRTGSRTVHITGGQMLHAGVLGFVHPRTGEYLEFKADFPEDFQAVLDTLRSGR
ncbi:MAG: RluA family pseudouridine synthase [Eubacterium sp.]|nr:RluA family pseudouridine synthase [Eubacterium sp.]